MKNDTIVINPEIRFGKPTIKGTRITVDEVLGWLAAGMDYEQIKTEYNITKNQIVAAVQYVEGWVHHEQVRPYALPA